MKNNKGCDPGPWKWQKGRAFTHHIPTDFILFFEINSSKNHIKKGKNGFLI